MKDILLPIFLAIILLGVGCAEVEPTLQEDITDNIHPTSAQNRTINKSQTTDRESSVSDTQVIIDEEEITNKTLDETKASYYQVTKVIDGDTIDVSIDGTISRVRLIGIDTPETVDPRKSVECFGKEASDQMKYLLGGKNVRLEYDATQDDKDKYGRLLRYVFRDDGMFVNQWMIENGFANEYTYNIPYQYQKEFKQAERLARENQRGLWQRDVCE